MKKNDGANLKAMVATGGTVQLHVDHANEAYCVDADTTYHQSDFKEVLGYLLAHGFALMDEDECPYDDTATGFRIWACHSDGKVFA